MHASGIVQVKLQCAIRDPYPELAGRSELLHDVVLDRPEGAH
jgi:hypothetical protein